jgi:methyltransferase
MNALAYALVAAVAIQRLSELVWAQRNTRRLLAQGAVESGARHYPFIVLLHTSWLAAILYFLPPHVTLNIALLVVFLILQAARVWVMVSLGPWFTTRVFTLPGAALVRTGPYRFLRHPNYLVVVGEILTLPLVFGETRVAVVFSILNAAMLAWRIRVEDAVLAPRRRPA